MACFAIFIASQAIVVTITAAAANDGDPIASPTCQPVSTQSRPQTFFSLWQGEHAPTAGAWA